MGKRGPHEADRGRHEADRGRHEADRGRHEADRGPHEADRGPHEAEQEKTKFLGPNSVGLGLGYFKRVGSNRLLVNSVRWSVPFVGQVRCDGRSDVNHWMKSIRASETITQKHSDAYRSSLGVTITTRLALKQSLSTTSIANLHNCL
ncbi:hypothetical protein T06_7861 [Trichinella sp. T6]|nr:hypothetical protein T06_7861 [Trichinella sp. T6]